MPSRLPRTHETRTSRSFGLAVALLFGALYSPQPVNAQPTLRSTITPGGALSASDRASLSWTLGDLAAALYLTPTLSYREGFQSVPAYVRVLTPLPATWDVRVYPNPARSTLRVAFNGAHDPCTLRLLDKSGSEITRMGVLSDRSEAELNLGEIASGSYFLWLLNIDGATVGGFVVMIIR